MSENVESGRPRLWPSLAVGLGALVLAGVVSNVALYLIVSPTLGPGQEFGQEAIEAWMAQNMATPAGFFRMVVPIHLTILALALLAASRSRSPILERLGLVRGRALAWHYPVLMLGTLGAAAISGWLFLAHMSPGESDMALALAFTQVGGFDGFLIILYAATMATFSEELLFSGFVLRGLLRRWKPVYAIGLAAVLFAVTHPSPFFMLHALPLGIWSGVVVWRTRSIWPAVACHSFTNVALALLNRWYPEPTVAFFGELTFWPIAVGVFGIVMMSASVWALFRRRTV